MMFLENTELNVSYKVLSIFKFPIIHRNILNASCILFCKENLNKISKLKVIFFDQNNKSSKSNEIEETKENLKKIMNTENNVKM